jgi:hypothetical protein
VLDLHGLKSARPSKEAVLRVHDKAGRPTEEIYDLPVEVV